jgi:RNA polymerase sigma-70 factor (ECF subfamily)
MNAGRPCRGNAEPARAIQWAEVPMPNADSLARAHSSPALTDHQLAEQAARGDGPAFAAIMRRHNRMLFRTARSILKSDVEAEDALQEAYLRAWRAIDGFRSEAKLSTWLARIVINESLARLRRGRGAQVIPLDNTATEHDQDPMEDRMEDDPDQQPERAAMRGELRRLMEACIDRLPDAFRSVFILRAVEECSVEDVAAALNLPEATVRTRFFRARGLLREGLSRDIDLAIGDAFSFDGERCDRIVARVLKAAPTSGNVDS